MGAEVGGLARIFCNLVFLGEYIHLDGGFGVFGPEYIFRGSEEVGLAIWEKGYIEMFST